MTAPLAGQSAALPPDLATAVRATLATWQAAGNVRRLWARDAALWTGADESQWLGWLDNDAAEAARSDERRRFADDVRRDGFSHALLLGMGGSSLGAEVIAETFGAAPGHPRLIVLDATDPAQIRSVERRIDLARTLFIVSSKSGTTLEPNILMRYFLARAADAMGADNVGAHAVAITDPGSALEIDARRRGFRRVFHGLPSIGGRYSVLSAFGLVPAAIIGVDPDRLIAASQRMAAACGAGVDAAANPGVVLGIILGVAARAGRDKATIIASRPASPDSALGSNSSSPNRPASTGAASCRSMASRRDRRRSMVATGCSFISRWPATTTRNSASRWRRWNAPDIPSCASRSPTATISAASSSAGRSRPRSPVR